MNTIYKAQLLQKRRSRIRKKVVGTAARPRLSVKFSGQDVYASGDRRRSRHDLGFPCHARS